MHEDMRREIIKPLYSPTAPVPGAEAGIGPYAEAVHCYTSPNRCSSEQSALGCR
jgi:hypothetical protein